jgi:hypothetical protein
MTHSGKQPRIPEPSFPFFMWALGLSTAGIFLVLFIEMAWRGHA